MVRVQDRENRVFEMDPAWMAVLHQNRPLRLPVRNRAVAEELLRYAREEENRQRRLKKNSTQTAKLDAFFTGSVATPLPPKENFGGPKSAIESAMEEEFVRSFKSYELLWEVGRAARELYMFDLYQAIYQLEVTRLVGTGITDEEGARAQLNIAMGGEDVAD